MSDYITFKLWKAGIIVAILFVVGLWQGLKGRDDGDDDH
jgi:hypothetical protein